ncbi:MAG: hypothetical protein ABIK73_00580 [candidate division WOR-3 bacterium]
MKQCLVLTTNFRWKDAPNVPYWEKNEAETPYRGMNYNQLDNWHELAENCPLPGIGRYYREYKSYAFDYLMITGMRYDESNGRPFFAFRYLQRSRTSSVELNRRLPIGNLFCAVDPDTILRILDELGEQPPQDWLNLFETEIRISVWTDWIGQRFLDLKDAQLSNDEFEDRVFELFRALGLEGEQMGHKKEGTYPDGVVWYPESTAGKQFGFVYDCKNSVNYVPTADHLRAIEDYYQREQNAYSVPLNYKVFVAKGFGLHPHKV